VLVTGPRPACADLLSWIAGIWRGCGPRKDLWTDVSALPMGRVAPSRTSSRAGESQDLSERHLGRPPGACWRGPSLGLGTPKKARSSGLRLFDSGRVEQRRGVGRDGCLQPRRQRVARCGTPMWNAQALDSRTAAKQQHANGGVVMLLLLVAVRQRRAAVGVVVACWEQAQRSSSCWGRRRGSSGV
jgi:hypothetical protein